MVQIRQGLNKLHPLSLSGVLLLEDGVELVLFLVGDSCLFLNIDGVDKGLRVIHVAPPNHTPMIGEGRKLVFLYVFIHSFLDIEVIARHFCNLLLKLLPIQSH